MRKPAGNDCPRFTRCVNAAARCSPLHVERLSLSTQAKSSLSGSKRFRSRSVNALSRLVALLLLPALLLSGTPVRVLAVPASRESALPIPEVAARHLLAVAGVPATRHSQHQVAGALGNLPAFAGRALNTNIYPGEQLDGARGLYYLRARLMNPLTGRFWSADSYEGDTADPVSLHKYLYANADPIDGTDPTGNATLVEIQVSTTIESSWASRNAERVGRLYARSWASRRWMIWRVELKRGAPWFRHTFIWAQDVQTKRAFGYHVLADVEDMIVSRRLRQFIPGLFVVSPQAEAERFGPFRLPVVSKIPVGFHSNVQFLVWNALNISTLLAEFMGDAYVSGFPYRLPDCNCITWTDSAARSAAVISAIPF